MFYLSRAERAGLYLLLALLLAGAGVYTYARGRNSALPDAGQPLFAPAPRETAPREDPGLAPPGADSRPSERTRGQERLSLNSATARELEALPGIGPVYAQRIIDYREKSRRERGHGFLSVDELLSIPGIGPKRFAAVRDRVVP